MDKLKRIMGRSWAFVIYPDSLPDNWQEIIRNTGLPMALSPLHNMDIDPTGQPKKPHYHVICYYENPTTANNVYQNVCLPLNGTIPIKLESMRGMYRYHIHIDNPDKYQYDDREREFFNGFDVASVSSMTATEEFKLLKELFQLIRNNDIHEFTDLINYLIDFDLHDLFEIANKKYGVIATYITSKRNKLRSHIDNAIRNNL